MYPAMLNLTDKKVTIIGGGKVAYRKAKSFLTCGAKVSIFAPSVHEGFEALQGVCEKIIVCEVSEEDLQKYLAKSFIVVAATNQYALNESIGRYCAAYQILCNVIDNPALSSFIVPGVVRRGDLCISVSTHGKSPALTQKIKNELEQQYGPSDKEYVDILGRIRESVLEQMDEEEVKKEILHFITTLDLEGLKAYEKSHFSS